MGNWLLFTHHYPARCFGMNMPKSRDMQVKMPLTKVILNAFLHVTVKALSSYRFIYFAESLYFVRSSIQLPTVKETDAQ